MTDEHRVTPESLRARIGNAAIESMEIVDDAYLVHGAALATVMMGFVEHMEQRGVSAQRTLAVMMGMAIEAVIGE